MKKSRFASLLSLVVLSLSACTVNPLISRVDHGSDSDPSAPGSSSSQPASQNSGSGRSSSSSRASSSQPSVPPADYVGEYAPKFVEDGKFLYYGLYPLSHIKDASLCEAISERGVPQPNGWFLYEGQYYANQFGNPIMSFLNTFISQILPSCIYGYRYYDKSDRYYHHKAYCHNGYACSRDLRSIDLIVIYTLYWNIR